MINGICSSLKISARGDKREKVKRIVTILNSPHLKDIVHALPEDARNTLAFVTKKGGTVGYSDLVKKFDDDTGMWWEENPPRSPVGILRRHALVVVGRLQKGRRFYKVAIVPNEIMQQLSSLELQ